MPWHPECPPQYHPLCQPKCHLEYQDQAHGTWKWFVASVYPLNLLYYCFSAPQGWPPPPWLTPWSTPAPPWAWARHCPGERRAPPPPQFRPSPTPPPAAQWMAVDLTTAPTLTPSPELQGPMKWNQFVNLTLKIIFCLRTGAAGIPHTSYSHNTSSFDSDRPYRNNVSSFSYNI